MDNYFGSNDFVYPNDEDKDELREIQMEAREKILDSILSFLFPKKTRKLSSVGLRAFALVWLVRPSWLGNNPSQEDVAKMLGVKKAALNKYISAARDHWRGLVCNGLRSEAARAKHAQFARENADQLAEARRAAIKRKKAENEN